MDIKSFVEIDHTTFDTCRADLCFRSKIDYQKEETIQIGCSDLVAKNWRTLKNTKLCKKLFEI